MKINKKFTKNGNIKTKYIDTINKRYIWQYITYIRLYNKDKPIFKLKYNDENINTMNPKYLYLLVKTKLEDESIKRTSIDNKTLKSFLFKILQQPNIKIPMLKN